MPEKRHSPTPVEGKETPVSILGIDRREEMLWIASEAAHPEDFPPCIKGIIAGTGGEVGKYRKAAILASFLGQAGWREAEAKKLWSAVALAEERIFEEWFGKMHCPKCETLKRRSKGYPDTGIADLGLCLPDGRCQEFEGPVEYACKIMSEDDRQRGIVQHIKTRFLVRAFDWSKGKEMQIEISEAEHGELAALQAELTGQENKTLVYARIKVRGRLRPRFVISERDELRRNMLSDLF
ncbi:Uncharacterised protein [uncultured archaeon]|nr:Uncharacterised protein [uncultured archaeon]